MLDTGNTENSRCDPKIECFKGTFNLGVKLTCNVMGLVHGCGKGCGTPGSTSLHSAWLWTAFSRVIVELVPRGTQKAKACPDQEGRITGVQKNCGYRGTAELGGQ